MAARAAEIPASGCWTTVGACWPTSTYTSSGGRRVVPDPTPADLHRVLRENVPVRLGRTIRSLEQLGGPVQVTFDDGSRGEFDLVVGADGLRSSVRRLAVDDRPPIPVGQHSWRFLAACPPRTTTWTVLLGRGTSFLTVPVEAGWSTATPISPRMAPSAGRTATPSPSWARGSPTSPTLSRSCWTNSTTRPGSMSHRSSRSPAQAGAGARCCWSATPPTACRPTWPRVPPSPSRTPWC